MSTIFKAELDDKKLEELFNSEEKCYEFLAELKWSEGFTCRKCGNTNYCPGKTPYSRRCTRCKTEESSAAGTIFHNCKFPISKAFYIAYNVCKGKEDISTYEFATAFVAPSDDLLEFQDKDPECPSADGFPY